MKLVSLLLVSGALGALASPVIDDRKLRDSLQKKLAAVAEREDRVTGEELASQLEKARSAAGLGALPPARSDGKMRYDDEAKGVVLIGSVYKCGKCDKWHLGGGASAWVLAADGLMVTNDHVFDGKDEAAFGIMTLDGRFAEVVSVEVADEAADIAVFRVKGKGFTPLPVAKEVAVGEAVHVISHPDGRHFSYTAGRVSRMWKQTGKKRPVTWMTVTADYAKGSSGGPVFNDRGEVVGMVSNTSSIYYGRTRAGEKPRQKGPLQMVIKNCVSLPELKAVLERKGKTAKLEE